MRTNDFDYHLPESAIAQHPAEPRDSARLLVLHRATGELEHRTFRDLGDYLAPGDLLVRNDSRVLPARLEGRRPGTGGRVEALLLRRAAAGSSWEALLKPSARLKPGATIAFPSPAGKPVLATVGEFRGGGVRMLHFPSGTAPETLGATPLPPYIRAPLDDPERYQTVYAREPGSAAAPTAGLHFTQPLLERLAARGVEIVSLTLHVGIDTFRPVHEDDPRDHAVHREYYALSAAAAGRISAAAAAGARIVCVGTTSVRSLEDAVHRSGWSPGRARTEQPPVRSYCGLTDRYILPGYAFAAVDGMITNFHLPRTTLLMLVSAFAGKERVLQAYATARDLGYRFYSFGDAMLLL